MALGALTQTGCAPAIPPLKTRGATNTTTVCPFCGVGCGQVVSTSNDNVIHIEGDPGHPISEGTLCSKGAAAIQVVNNSRRLQKVLYRAPQGAKWEEKSWDWALERIATIRRMAALSGSGVRPDQVLATAQAFEKLINGTDRAGANSARESSHMA